MTPDRKDNASVAQSSASAVRVEIISGPPPVPCHYI